MVLYMEIFNVVVLEKDCNEKENKILHCFKLKLSLSFELLYIHLSIPIHITWRNPIDYLFLLQYID
jgi:hypothetical protein